MSVDGQFESLEQEIERLRDALDTCRRAILGARVALWGGAATLLAAFTLLRSLDTPTVVFGAIAAMIGGTVWYGANKSTREDLEQTPRGGRGSPGRPVRQGRRPQRLARPHADDPLRHCG